MGPPYTHIAVCIDDTDAARHALAEACALRALTPGRLTLVHVSVWPVAGAAAAALFDREELEEPERRWLQEQADAVPEADSVFLRGFPPGEVCDWARDHGVDLLVAAPHKNLFERALVGSFAAYLVRHAPCSVLLSRPGTTAGHHAMRSLAEERPSDVADEDGLPGNASGHPLASEAVSVQDDPVSGVLVARYTVTDYDRFKAVFDDFAPVRAQHGEIGHTVLRTHDPHEVIVLFEFPSEDAARGFAHDPARADALHEAGVFRRRDVIARVEQPALVR